MKLRVYYIVSVVTEIVEEAIEQFNYIDETIRNNFSILYGYIARPMNLMERLETLFDIYHPENKETFGTIVDYDGMATFAQEINMEQEMVADPSGEIKAEFEVDAEYTNEMGYDLIVSFPLNNTLLICCYFNRVKDEMTISIERLIWSFFDYK